MWGGDGEEGEGEGINVHSSQLHSNLPMTGSLVTDTLLRQKYLSILLLCCSKTHVKQTPNTLTGYVTAAQLPINHPVYLLTSCDRKWGLRKWFFYCERWTSWRISTWDEPCHVSYHRPSNAWWSFAPQGWLIEVQMWDLAARIKELLTFDFTSISHSFQQHVKLGIMDSQQRSCQVG